MATEQKQTEQHLASAASGKLGATERRLIVGNFDMMRFYTDYRFRCIVCMDWFDGGEYYRMVEKTNSHKICITCANQTNSAGLRRASKQQYTRLRRAK